MNLSISIPQLFYDFIARVLPGSLFLLFLKIELKSIDIKIEDYLFLLSSGSSAGAIFNGSCLVVISYLLGWIISSFVGKDKEENEYKFQEDGINIYHMQHKIRIKDNDVGFRIVKLRAEARMNETAFVATIPFVLFSIFTALLKIYEESHQHHENSYFLFLMAKPSILGVVAFAFWRNKEKSWDRYFGNVISHFKIIFPLTQYFKENEAQTMTKYNERYRETNQKSTNEISDLIRKRKKSGKETGVAERIYEERTGSNWQHDQDMEKAFE